MAKSNKKLNKQSRFSLIDKIRKPKILALVVFMFGFGVFGVYKLAFSSAAWLGVNLTSKPYLLPETRGRETTMCAYLTAGSSGGRVTASLYPTGGGGSTTKYITIGSNGSAKTCLSISFGTNSRTVRGSFTETSGSVVLKQYTYTHAY